MAEAKKLRVLPRGAAMVPHYDHQASGRRSFHGWKHDASLGPSFLDPATKQPRNHGAFVKMPDVVEIPMTSDFVGEYVRHLRDKDLWPADEFTAQAGGVKFDPTFGGEFQPPTSEAPPVPSEEPKHEPPAAPAAQEP